MWCQSVEVEQHNTLKGDLAVLFKIFRCFCLLKFRRWTKIHAPLYTHILWLTTVISCEKLSTANTNVQLVSQSQLLSSNTSPSVYKLVGEKTRKPLNVPTRNSCDIRGCVTGRELIQLTLRCLIQNDLSPAATLQRHRLVDNQLKNQWHEPIFHSFLLSISNRCGS